MCLLKFPVAPIFMWLTFYFGSQADAALYQVGYPDYLWNENKFSERYKMVILNKLIQCC